MSLIVKPTLPVHLRDADGAADRSLAVITIDVEPIAIA
jgi:hypothetical protein